MTSHSGSSFSDVALPSGVLDIVSRNPLPALIVEVPPSVSSLSALRLRFCSRHNVASWLVAGSRRSPSTRRKAPSIFSSQDG